MKMINSNRSAWLLSTLRAKEMFLEVADAKSACIPYGAHIIMRRRFRHTAGGGDENNCDCHSDIAELYIEGSRAGQRLGSGTRARRRAFIPDSFLSGFDRAGKRLFERNGLKAEIIRINSEPTTYQALISGDIDATSGAPTGLVQSNIQGVPVVSLGSWDNLVSYTMATREKVDDLSQLRGKKVGINRLGGKSSLVLRVMLEMPASILRRISPCCSSAARKKDWRRSCAAASTRRRWILSSSRK
jgi:hypothetical protein